MIGSFNCNLNIRYDQPKEYWDKLNIIYKSMNGWKGFTSGIPYWYGDNSSNHIEASVEPSGLQFYARLDAELWNNWIKEFREKCSSEFGYEVGEPEDGFKFPNLDEL